MEETELWLVDLDKAAAALAAVEVATPRLSDDILRRLEEMADDARSERRLAHIALRILLERRLGSGIRGTPFKRSASGKLSLASSGASFSLAHTRGLALIAISDGGPLGVDIERARDVRMPDSRRAPIEREAVALAADAPLSGPGRDARFLNAWVRIEAAAKAQGEGVGPLLERLRPDRAAEPPPGATEGPGPIVVHDVSISAGIFAAVACQAGQPPPLLRHFPQTDVEIDSLLLGGSGTRR
jgi:4'-phosphopantetheinyl transferase